MSRTYSDLKRLLGIRQNAVLTVFEQYCQDMRFNTRVLEWSCKLTPGVFEGARFLHTARFMDFDRARDAVRRLQTSLALTTETGFFQQLPGLADAVGEGIALGYAEDHRAIVSRTELKLYVTTSKITDVRSVIDSLVPEGAFSPDLSRVMIAASLDDQSESRSRVYFLWDQARLRRPSLGKWLEEWCTPEEISLIVSSSPKTLSIAFKEGRRDMIYLSAPFTSAEVNRFIVTTLEKHPLAFEQMDNLRWLGFSKFGEGLAGKEVNVYFNTVFP